MAEGTSAGSVSGRQRDEEDAVGEVLEHLGGDLEGKPGLARATRTDEGQQLGVVTPQQVDDLSHLLLPTQERGRLAGEVLRSGVHGSEGRKVSRQVGMDQVVHPLRLQQIAQPVLPEVAQFGCPQAARHGSVAGRSGRGESDPHGQPPTAARGGSAGPPGSPRAHPGWLLRHAAPCAPGAVPTLAPVLGQERALAGQGGPQRVLRGPKRRLGAIADGLEEDPVVGGNEALQDGQLPIDRLPHGGPIPLPERGGALDVGEEEGDGAAMVGPLW